MHTSKSLSLLLIVALFVSSCSEKKSGASLTVNLAGLGIEQIEVYNIEKGILHELSVAQDSIALDLTEAILLNLTLGRTSSYVYLQPGEDLVLDTISPETQTLTTRSRSSENEYLLSFSEIANKLARSQNASQMAKGDAASFLQQIEQKHQPLATLVAEIEQDNAVSKSFKTAMQKRMLANKGNDLLVYKQMYNYWNKVYPEMPADFYASIASVEPTDQDLLLFEEGRRFGDSWHSRDIPYEDYDSVDEYFSALMASAVKAYPNSLMGDYCQSEMLANQINFGGGIDVAGPAIEAFQSKVSNSVLLTKIEKIIAPWINLKSGLDAPNFTAKDRSGTPVQLSELKGKKVYIDVWATWCGPCIREIPALKALEADMHEENIEFVSISIDEAKDKEKWLSFLTEKDLGGLQLMADGAWRSEITTAYNIQGIPRFLLIDESGKIISANAPRPSDPRVREVLMN